MSSPERWSRLKKIRIFYSEFLKEQADGPIAHKGPGFTVDFSVLLEHYAKLGENKLRYLEDFIPQWNEQWEPELFDPKASVVLMDAGRMQNVFGDVLGDSILEEKMSALIVWTVGEGIEKKSSELMSGRGTLMSGFLLDVTGSLALYGMHRTLLEWVGGKVEEDYVKFISSEIYPGFKGVPQSVMDKIEIAAETAETIGVHAHGNSMMKPRKTQCCFIGFGDKKMSLLSAVIPCSPCAGRKCLYYQLGGCHMEVLASGKPRNLC